MQKTSPLLESKLHSSDTIINSYDKTLTVQQARAHIARIKNIPNRVVLGSAWEYIVIFVPKRDKSHRASLMPYSFPAVAVRLCRIK